MLVASNRHIADDESGSIQTIHFRDSWEIIRLSRIRTDIGWEFHQGRTYQTIQAPPVRTSCVQIRYELFRIFGC